MIGHRVIIWPDPRGNNLALAIISSTLVFPADWSPITTTLIKINEILAWIIFKALTPQDFMSVVQPSPSLLGFSVRNRPQILVLILMKLSELINFYSPWTHQNIYGYLMILEGIEKINSLNIKGKVWRRSQEIQFHMWLLRWYYLRF